MLFRSNDRITYVAFLECELRGKWTDPVVDHHITMGAEPEDFLTRDPPHSEQYLCKGDDCELWVVRPDGLRRAWHFKEHHGVIIKTNTVSFNQDSVIEELAVDDNKKF